MTTKDAVAVVSEKVVSNPIDVIIRDSTGLAEQAEERVRCSYLIASRVW